MSSTITTVNPAAAPPGDTPNPASGAPSPSTAAAQAQAVGWWRRVSPNAVIGAVGTLFAAAVTLVVALLVVQLTAINAGIASLDTKIDNVEARLDAKIDKVEANLRAEMQAGFREINAILLDHTDRLARLEAHAGLASVAPES